MNTGIVILAAGNSSRMGQPKQLLRYQGKTLLECVIDAALATAFRPVVVVIGAYADQILRQELPREAVYLINPEWQKGMSTSIRKGLDFLIRQEPELENVVLAVADQVHMTPAVFTALSEKRKESSKSIIASSYAGTLGTPVLFYKIHFDQLLALEGEQGAKTLLKGHADQVVSISFEQGHIDIDTAEDYLRLSGQ